MLLSEHHKYKMCAPCEKCGDDGCGQGTVLGRGVLRILCCGQGGCRERVHS